MLPLLLLSEHCEASRFPAELVSLIKRAGERGKVQACVRLLSQCPHTSEGLSVHHPPKDGLHRKRDLLPSVAN